MSKSSPIRPAAGTGTYRVLIRDLVLGARIGVWKREKHVDQRVRVNVEMVAARPGPLLGPDGRAGRRDRIIRYDTVVPRRLMSRLSSNATRAGSYIINYLELHYCLEIFLSHPSARRKPV